MPHITFFIHTNVNPISLGIFLYGKRKENTGSVNVSMVGIRIMVKMFSTFFLFDEREQGKMLFKKT